MVDPIAEEPFIRVVEYLLSGGKHKMNIIPGPSFVHLDPFLKTLRPGEVTHSYHHTINSRHAGSPSSK